MQDNSGRVEKVQDIVDHTLCFVSAKDNLTSLTTLHGLGSGLVCAESSVAVASKTEAVSWSGTIKYTAV